MLLPLKDDPSADHCRRPFVWSRSSYEWSLTVTWYFDDELFENQVCDILECNSHKNNVDRIGRLKGARESAFSINKHNAYINWSWGFNHVNVPLPISFVTWISKHFRHCLKMFNWKWSWSFWPTQSMLDQDKSALRLLGSGSNYQRRWDFFLSGFTRHILLFKEW